MEISQNLRTKLELGPDVSEASVWTQLLSDLNRRINEVDAEIAHVKVEVAAAVDDDAGDGRLIVLQSKREGQILKVEAARKKIAEALHAEREAALAQAWDAAKGKERLVEEAASELVTAIKILWAAARKVQEADAEYCTAIPAKASDWEERGFRSRLMNLIEIEIYVLSNGSLRAGGLIESAYQISLNPLNSIVGALREHIAMAYKARPVDDTAPAIPLRHDTTAITGE
jgi:hypothetical protein